MRETLGYLALMALAATSCSEKKSNDSSGGEGGSATEVQQTNSVASSVDGGVATTAIAVTTGTATSSGGNGTTAAVGSGGNGEDEPETPGGAGGEAGAPPVTVESSCPQFDAEALEVSQVDADCDANTPDVCESGTHIDFDEESACAVCVADDAENRSCTWATACFGAFIQTIAHRSGAIRCEDDTDCSGMTLWACGEEVSLSLNSSIDEEIPMVAEMYVEQNCSLCGDSEVLYYDWAGPSECIQGACTLLD